MERISVALLREGMRVGQTIRNEQGRVLLTRGTTLTPAFVAALRERGFQSIYIQDGVGDDILAPEVLSHQVNQAVHKHLHELFSVPKGADPAKGGGLDLKANDPRVAALYKDVKRIVKEVMNAETLTGMASIKSHDNYTFEHSVEVTVTGVLLGKRMNLPEWDLHQLALGCLCHDVGKIAIPPAILNKPGALDADELDLVKQHPTLGYDSARKFMTDEDIIARSVVWQHHERQDGSGYPQGLTGSNTFDFWGREFKRKRIIPVAEIAAVADVYSALASDRPYRPGMSPVEVAATLRQMAGTHLNSEVVGRFLSILPVYPIGTKVMIVSGTLKGCMAVVTDQNTFDVNRPVVRVVTDPAGKMVAPVEVDTSEEREMELAAATPSDVRRRLGDLVPA